MKRSELEIKEGQPPPAWLQTLEAQSEQEMAAVQQRLAAGSLKQRVAAAALRGDADAAALMAMGTDDAGVYRMALRACRKDAGARRAHAGVRAMPPASAASGFVLPEMPALGPVPHACAALSLERLEQLAPDDAWPWLARLNDSISRRDEAGISQALYQIAQRNRLSANRRR
ncbi:MAG: hypothetical protein ACT6S0_05780 [Roseateles sp.]|uniref:hypothetical protein n=1 Tax=Roseateles sp. TaxID=1971397 RepID=UPI0040353223